MLYVNRKIIHNAAGGNLAIKHSAKRQNRIMCYIHKVKSA